MMMDTDDALPDPREVYRQLREALPSTAGSKHPVDVMIQATGLNPGTHDLVISWPDAESVEYVVSDPDEEELYATLPIGEDGRSAVSISMDTITLRVYRYMRGGTEEDETPISNLSLGLILSLAKRHGTTHAEARYREFLFETGVFS